MSSAVRMLATWRSAASAIARTMPSFRAFGKRTTLSPERMRDSTKPQQMHGRAFAAVVMVAVSVQQARTLRT